MFKQESDIFELAEIIVRSMQKELPESKQQLLDAWLAESEEHQTQYAMFQETAFLQERLKQHQAINYQEDYRLFADKQQQKRQSHPRFLRHITRYAAVIAILLSGIIGLYLSDHQTEIPEIANESATLRKKAVLTLAKGEQIALSDTIQTLLQSQAGADINIEGSQISYHVKEEDTTTVQYNSLQTPRGGEFVLTLSDGSRVWLNAESEIRYPVKFTDEKRLIYIQGEAFLEVATDPEHPFVIVSNQTEITVLGTSFNFRSYPEEENIITTLVSGSVRMTSDAKQDILLSPGEQGILDKKTGTLSKQLVETYLYTAWKDGRIVFRETRLEDLFNFLARWYDLQIVYHNPETKDIRFTGDIDKTEDFHSILKIIELNERVHFSVDNRVVHIRLQ